jgi:23S rRNA (pseudouridine1915-N3)-methyltransferase
VRVIVLGEGRLRPPYEDDVAHYSKLLSRYTRLEVSFQRDAAAAARAVPAQAFVSLLAVEGSSYDSVAFSVFLQERRHAGRDVAFVIGGPFGAPPLQRRVDHRLSLGPLTLPHQLARVVLLEQLYRAHKILAGEPYHY